MNTFAERLRAARERCGISIKQLARDAGVSPQAVYNWESGAIPKPDRLEKIAEQLGVPLQWLMFDEGEIRAVESESGTILVPLLDVAHSAGPGGNAAWSDGDIVMRLLELNPAWVLSNLTCMTAKGNLAMVHVNGDSMEPTLHHSDVILVDRGYTRISRDGVYVAELDDSFFVKRFQRVPGGKIMMISDNKFYREMEFDPNDPAIGFKVGGLALWVWQGNRLF